MRALLLAFALLLAAPACAQVGTVLGIAEFALDLRRNGPGTTEAERAAEELDRRIGQILDRQISAPEMTGLLDARLDAFEMRRMSRTLGGAALRLEACRTARGACAGELAEIDSILRRSASEIAASPPGAVTIGLLERARALHLAVLAELDAPPAELDFIRATYDRYYAALGSAAPGSASEAARGDLLSRLAGVIGIAPRALELGHHDRIEALIDETLAEQGPAILLAGLRSHFDGGLRFLEAETAPGAAAVFFNCRLNRDRPGILDGRLSPLRLPVPLTDLVEDETELRFPGTPVSGAAYEVIWLGAALTRSDEGVDIEAGEFAIVDDAAGRFALEYGGGFYLRGSTSEPATIGYRGARTDADLLETLGVFPWAPGACVLTDGVVLTDAEAGLSGLEATIRRTWQDVGPILQALVELERLRDLAQTLSGA